MLHRPRPQKCRSHARMSHDKGRRHVGDRQPGFLRQRDQLFDSVKAALVGELLRKYLARGESGVGWPCGTCREHALGQRTPHHHAHAVALWVTLCSGPPTRTRTRSA